MKTVEICDYRSSFVTFRIDTKKQSGITVSQPPPFTLNNCRGPIDCRLVITDKRTETSETFSLMVNCKSEQVNVKEGIWHQPNADVSIVFGSTQALIIKAWDHCGRRVMLHPETLGPQPPRHIVLNEEAYDSVRVDVAMTQATVLSEVDQIVNAVLHNVPLLSRTEIENDRYHALIEYPVNLINASEREMFYQTDTGPVLLPDLSREPEDMIAGLELAYVGHNAPDWAEFIVRVPTKINDDVEVLHYSEPRRYTAKNTVLRYAM